MLAWNDIWSPTHFRLQPMLAEIAKDRKTVAMATLDYVQADTFEYRYNHDYLTRYGWTWSLGFFESLFRDDQIGQDERSPRVYVYLHSVCLFTSKCVCLHVCIC